MTRATVLKIGALSGEGVVTNKANGLKIALEPPMDSAQRRKLGDITNLQNQRANQQQSSTEYVEKLHKDNMNLTKLLMERNKIMEMNGSKLQRLRINFHKVQGQNLQLAQTNTRLLAEVNTSKDQLKVLQHQLSCKNAVLMARKLPLEEQNLPRTHCHESEDKDPADFLGGDCERADNKRRVSRRKNPDNCENVTSIPGESIETTNIKRVSLRRRSTRFNIHELAVTENLNVMHDDQKVTAKAGCSTSDQSIGSNPEAVEPHDTNDRPGKSRVSTRSQTAKVKHREAISSEDPPPLQNDIVEEPSKISSSVSMELSIESKNKPRGDEAEEVGITSVGGRPSRQAAGKIKSYKEPSLKEKMRRSF